MRTKLVLLASAAALLALPALAQQSAAPQPAPVTAPTAAPTPTTATALPEGGTDESAVEELSNVSLEPPSPPVEYPGWARRDPWTVGPLDPASAGLSADAWGDSSGAFLSTLMRRMHTPLGSRWAHI